MFKSKKNLTGFTLVELMVVVIIVGILAAAGVALYRGQIDKSKWSEGKAMAGTIKRAVRTYCSEKGEDYSEWGTVTLSDIGFEDSDLDGTYFSYDCFTVAISDFMDFEVTVNADNSTREDAPTIPTVMKLDEGGNWIQ